MRKLYGGRFRVDPAKLLAAINGMDDAGAGAYFRRLCVLLIEQRYGVCREADELIEQAENLSRVGRQNARRRWPKQATALPPHEAEPMPQPVPAGPAPGVAGGPLPSNLARAQTLAETACEFCGCAGSQAVNERFQKAIDHIGESAFRSMLAEAERDCGDGAATERRAATLANRLRAARAAGWR